MSQDKIITQPLGDPVGSIYEIDGKCYIKTSNASGTMNNLVRKSDGECATDVSSDLTKCETGAGARTATTSASPGSYTCRGEVRSIVDINHVAYASYAPYWDTWMLNYTAPGGTVGPVGRGIDNTVIPYQPQYPRPYGTRGKPDPMYGDYWYSMRVCRILHGGYVQFNPTSVVRGFDEILFWGRVQWPYYRAAGYFSVSVQHAQTDEWHTVKVWTPHFFRQWLGQTLGYSDYQINRINPTAYLYGGTLHPYIHLSPSGPSEYLQVDPKFHNMPIKSVQIYYRTGTDRTRSFWINTLQMYKNGEKINLLDNSIVLRSTPAKGHGAL